jgi:hypothetical protein
MMIKEKGAARPRIPGTFYNARLLPLPFDGKKKREEKIVSEINPRKATPAQR